MFEDFEGEVIDPSGFRSLTAKIGFVAAARPDILAVVAACRHHQHAPRKEHWDVAYSILEYLNGTKFHGRVIAPTPQITADAEHDASFNSLPGSRSQAGGILRLAGVPVKLVSKQIEVLPTSSAIAEMCACYKVLPELRHLRDLVEELQPLPLPVSTLYGDSHPMMTMVTNGFSRTAKTRPLALRLNAVKEALVEGWARLAYTPTDQLPADGLTKYLVPTDFERFRESIGIRDLRPIHISNCDAD